jgi:hypothetical protein
MIRNQDLTTLFVIIILLIFYFLQIFQRAKLVYLFRSVSYHFRNILVPYNVHDLGISGSGTSIINYFNYFYLFFFLLINIVVMTNFGALSFHGSINFDEMGNELFIRLLNFNILIFITLSVRFLVIKYIIEMFLNYKIKFIFFKNYIINIIIGILMLINFVVYSLNTFYDFIYLRNTFLILLLLHFIFQAKNYLSYFSKIDIKEVMYFILYLCGFKLAPWIWLYSIY